MFVSCDQKTADINGQMDQDTSKNVVAKVPAATVPENGTSEGDTLNISGRHVLFFYPSESKAKSLNLSEQDVSRFKSSVKSIIDSIAVISAGATASMTDLGHVRIYGRKGFPMILSLTSFSEPFGMVISDGTQMAPITKGIRAKEAYIEQIRRVLNFETSSAK
ncbi:MAG: hypothetical protein ACKOYC_00460 [Bacteroidota bacterium]